MSKSVWTVLLIGFLSVITLILAMLMTLTQFEGTPAWMQTKLANTIKAQFDFVAVGTEQVVDAGSRTKLRIQYESKPGKTAFSQDLARQEMQKVAEFAVTKFDSKDRINIDTIDVQRTEVHGRGCFQNTYTARHSIPNPLKGADGKPAGADPDRVPSIFR